MFPSTYFSLFYFPATYFPRFDAAVGPPTGSGELQFKIRLDRLHFKIPGDA